MKLLSGIENIIKRQIDNFKERNFKMSSILLLVLAIFLAALGQILLKKGMLSVGAFSTENFTLVGYFLKSFANIYVLGGIFFYVLGTLVWLLVLSRLPLSLAYPCLALGYVIVAILSKYLFGETITFLRWLGIITVCLGIFLISRTI